MYLTEESVQKEVQGGKAGMLPEVSETFFLFLSSIWLGLSSEIIWRPMVGISIAGYDKTVPFKWKLHRQTDRIEMDKKDRDVGRKEGRI